MAWKRACVEPGPRRIRLDDIRHGSAREPRGPHRAPLRAWLAAAGIERRPIFRPIDRAIAMIAWVDGIAAAAPAVLTALA